MKLPLKSPETRETPIREVYDTTTIPELLQLIDSILEELHRSLGITSVEANQSEKNQTSTDGPDPVDSKRLSEPFFLKKILLENSSERVSVWHRVTTCGNRKSGKKLGIFFLLGMEAGARLIGRHYQQKLSPVVQRGRETLTGIDVAIRIHQRGRETLTGIDVAIRIHQRCRFPQIVRDPDPLGLSNGDDHLHGSVGIHRRQQRLARRRFSPEGN
ncbi:unnamed protein product [Brassica rapa]|uniref:Uncharacterized protein n=2 Tax=Brassica TaxID=3705 RepID=A0A8D9M5Q4_BRACM|nr:unnamed protein product [Brassica napus]CAG7899396.1 unnamed protein product [Brassica rapa]